MSGAPADHRITMRQVGVMTFAAVGARDFVHDDPNGLLMFRVGGGPTYRKILIRLEWDDLYRVEVGHIHRRSLDWVSEHVLTGIDAEALSGVVRDLADGRYT